VIILAASVYIMRIVVIEAINIGRQEFYAPLQPIKFSHKVLATIVQPDDRWKIILYIRRELQK